jgi:hypothetical protein
MRYWIALVLCALGGCALQPPKPSIWMLENECQIKSPIDEIAGCTRASLDTQYGSAWRSAAPAMEFLSFIDITVLQVRQGVLNDQQARTEITSYATRQASLIQAEQAQRDAAKHSIRSALEMRRPMTG